MEAILLVDFGSTYTKVTAVSKVNEEIIATAKAFTTVSTDICVGLNLAIEELEAIAGALEFVEKYACSSAAGGLKMIAVGLVPELTAEAAKKAALNAGAKVLKVYSYELSEDEADEIKLLKPDIVLLTGGTDGGNKDVLLQNAKRISEIPIEFPVIVAGNKVVAKDAARILENGGKEVLICPNVMPEFNSLNIEPTKACIRELFLRKIIRAKGLSKVESIVNGILMPTPAAVLKSGTLLAKGYGDEVGIGELIMVDVGGATTDVYSIANGEPKRSVISYKGLPEPFEKRTVEGDLGVRYCAAFLVQEAGIENIAKVGGITVEEVKTFLCEIENNPGVLADTEEFRRFDMGLAYYAVKIACDRHVGKIEEHYSINGVVVVQAGKDLTGVTRVIGTGGPVINCINASQVLSGAVAGFNDRNLLKPMAAKYILDSNYIMSAMGLIADKYPEMALRIMKKNLCEQNN